MTDGDAISMTTQTVQIQNAAPSAFADDAADVVEGTVVWLPYSTSDPGNDSVTLQGTPVCGTGSFVGVQPGYFACRLPDGPSTEHVTFQVADEDGATAVGSLDVGVVNVSPTIYLTTAAGV